ncbi:hypothetical protein AYO49_06085 [Verrucomicrobiaceae bacterium SCGC AG-212-N21]|nr:hypothetical protein AYO49_06085 [Verrucomicrobiaceae bacterium SCGC AG-212-N21]
MRARSFFSFVFGCALGAGVVWFGLSKSLVVLPTGSSSQIVLVDRWTGEGRYVKLRVDDGEAAAPRRRVPPAPEVELEAEKTKQLQSKGEVGKGKLEISLHNHLDDVVLKSAVVQVQVAASDGVPAVDRLYTVSLNGLRGSSGIPPHTDGDGEVHAWFPVSDDALKSATVTLKKVTCSKVADAGERY